MILEMTGGQHELNHQQQSSGKVTDVLFQFAGTASLVEE